MITPVFENEYVLIVDKPVNMLSVPSRLGDKEPRPCVLYELSKLYGKLFPVHRLDFEVSGLLVFAKTADAHRKLSGYFENHSVRKTYHALTNAGPFAEGDRFEWRSLLVRGKKRSFERPYGKEAITKATVLRSTPAELLWSLEPVTGRSHQLRYELAKFGYPIWGDVLYGAGERKDGIALRAMRIDFSKCSDFSSIKLPETFELGGQLLDLFGQNSVA